MQKMKALFLTLVVALTLVNPASAAQETHVGIVTGLDSGTFRLIHESGESDLTKGAKLYPGDVIKKSAAAKLPEIMWWPYAGWKDPTAMEQLEVSFQPPAAPEKKGFLQNVKSFLGFVETDYASVHGVADETKEMQRENKFKESSEERQAAPSATDAFDDEAGSSLGLPPAASTMDGADRTEGLSGAPQRGNMADKPRPQAKPKKTAKDFLQPGLNATLVPGIPVDFRAAGSSSPRHQLLFRKPDGNVGLKKPYAGIVTMNPEDIGMPPQETWTWELAGTPALSGKIRILSPDFVTMLRADLKTLQTEIRDVAERKVKAAAYLQFLSDTYPREVSLYWLSLRMLDAVQVPADKPQLTALRDKLYARALDHFGKEQPQP